MIVLLTSDDSVVSLPFAALLAKEFPSLVVIHEKAVSRDEINRIRLKKLGAFYIVSERLRGFAHKFVRLAVKPYIKQRIASLDLPSEMPSNVKEFHVENVNSPECLALLQQLNPKAIAVFNTRILKEATLKSISAPFINYHCGINPKYRGQYPTYWALAVGDAENCGITVHLVDKGVDTGDVLYQKRLSFSKKDVMSIHFLIALPHGAELMIKALRDACDGALKPYRVDLPSMLHYPPTLWRYLWVGITRGVW